MSIESIYFSDQEANRMDETALLIPKPYLRSSSQTDLNVQNYSTSNSPSAAQEIQQLNQNISNQFINSFDILHKFGMQKMNAEDPNSISSFFGGNFILH